MRLSPGYEPMPGYRLERFIGRGRFGDVWEAIGPRGQVALKFVDLRDDAGAKELRGLRRVEKIRHPGLVTILDVFFLDEEGGVLDDQSLESSEKERGPTGTVKLSDAKELRKPVLLIVEMTYANRSLRSLLTDFQQRGEPGIPATDLLRYMDSVAGGIDHLNTKEHLILDRPGTIQHCDIKPENMLLVSGAAVVCDFGLAQALSNDGDRLTKSTNAGMGTPAYIAPELLGTQPIPTPQTDQYSLAVSYFQLRTGELPFPEDASFYKVLEIHREGKLDLSAVPGNRERVVLKKATSVKPDHRYEDCSVFAARLRAAIQRDERAQEKKEQEYRRDQRRSLATTLAVVLASLSVCVAAIAYTFGGPHDGDDIALVEANSETPSETDGQLKPDLPHVTRKPEISDAAPIPKSTSARTLIELRQDLEAANKQLADADTQEEPSRERWQEIASLFQAVASATRSKSNHNWHSVWVQATLGSARVWARQSRWNVVASLLENTQDHELTERDAAHRDVLTVLAAVENDPRRRIDVALEGCFQLVQSSRWNAIQSWERTQIVSVLLESCRSIEAGEQPLSADESIQKKLRTVFQAAGRQDNDWIVISDAARVLKANATLSRAELDALHDSLAGIQSRRQSEADTSVREHLQFLMSIRSLKDPDSDLAKILGSIKVDFGRPEWRKRLGSSILSRLETDMAMGPLADGVYVAVEDLLERMSGQEWLMSVVHSLRMITGISAEEYSYDSVLRERRSLRASDVRLRDSTLRIIDICWAESAVQQQADGYRAVRRAINDALDAPLDAIPSSSAWIDYVAYVRAYKAMRIDNRSALEVLRGLDPLLERIQAGLASIDFLDNKKRSQFLEDLLIRGARQLRVPGVEDAQIDEPIYERDQAIKALRYLQLAADLFDGQLAGEHDRESRRRRILAMYYAETVSDETIIDEIGRLGALAASEENSGHLLLVEAMTRLRFAAARTPDNQARDEAVLSLARLISWRTHFGSNEVKFYYGVITKAVEVLSRYHLGKGDAPQEREVAKYVPSNLRSSLASIYACAAELVGDPDVYQHSDFSRKQFKSKRERQLNRLKKRYLLYQRAAVLRVEVMDYVFGQYWALKEWADWSGESVIDEKERLLEAAERIASEDPRTIAMRGELQGKQAQAAATPEAQKQLLVAATDNFDRFLDSQPGGDQELAQLLNDLRPLVLVLRSAARVQYAFYRPYLDQYELLDGARLDAGSAIREFPLRRNPSFALMARANALEDIAHYCHVERKRNLEAAYKDFRTVSRMKGADTLKAELALGRCLSRFPNLTDALADEAKSALSSVIADASSKAMKAEAHCYLADIQSWQKASDEAEESYKESVQLSAGGKQWPTYKLALARLANTQFKFDKAVQHADDILGEYERRPGNVSGKNLYDAFKVKIGSVARPQVPSVIANALERYLVAGSPGTARYRILWIYYVVMPQKGLTDKDPFELHLSAETLLNDALNTALLHGYRDLEVRTRLYLALQLHFQDARTSDSRADAVARLFESGLTEALTIRLPIAELKHIQHSFRLYQIHYQEQSDWDSSHWLSRFGLYLNNSYKSPISDARAKALAQTTDWVNESLQEQ